MEISRRSAIALVLMSATLPAWTAFAQTTPLVVYENELKDGWQHRSWAKVETPTMAGGDKPMRVQGDAWSALVLHHAAFSSEPYTKLTFFISGGAEGGQRLAVKIMADGKALESGYVIEPKARTWGKVEVALKDLAAANRQIEGLMLQADGTPYKAYYITRIQFE